MINSIASEILGNRLVTFARGSVGSWEVTSLKAVLGESIPPVHRIMVCRGAEKRPENALWSLSGVISNVRYVEGDEQKELSAKQPPLGRTEATCAALIPVRKTEAWWALSQDKRRAIFEAQSHHIREGMTVLPWVARQLLHSRDIGEPFDFLTWFEYAPNDSGRFEELVGTLRQTEEWKYVDREVDLRLTLFPAPK